jgi:hypothetical protein
MPATLLRILAISMLLALAPAAFAADVQPAPQADKKKKPAAAWAACQDGCKCEPGQCTCDARKKDQEKRVVLTGSHLPQRGTKHGRITTGISPVVVYTADDLKGTGATDIAAALRKLSPVLH